MFGSVEVDQRSEIARAAELHVLEVYLSFFLETIVGTPRMLGRMVDDQLQAILKSRIRMYECAIVDCLLPNRNRKKCERQHPI